MKNQLDEEIQFRRELFFAFIVAILACVIGQNNLIFASNDLYPITSDAMGHMAKVSFIAESISKGEFPSWFPFWYDGSVVTQYYPPFSYWVMALILLVAKNVMLTYKIYCFYAILTGSIGVWFFCRKSIGSWCGLIGIVLFCLQPSLLRTLYSAGQVAQGPIIALTPWYLVGIFMFLKKPSGKNFFFSTAICVLLILGHPNTAYMNCLCIFFSLFIMVILKQIPFFNYLVLGLSVVLAGVITVFWSLVGVTGLENPGIPYLLGEAVEQHTATLEWYLNMKSGWFIFAIPVSIGVLMSIGMYILQLLFRKLGTEDGNLIGILILISITTFVFSFGLHIPMFEHIPMAKTLVTGRILNLTATSGAILCSYLFYKIVWYASFAGRILKIVSFGICLALFFVAVGSMASYIETYQQKTDRDFNQTQIASEADVGSFDKGRYGFVASVDCSETYFPITYGFNITDGWNIEGSPHNQRIWNYSVALVSGNADYVAKSLAYENTRYLLVGKKQGTVVEALNKKYHFDFVTKRFDNTFYKSNDPSSYLLKDSRNALVIGQASAGVAIEFPFLVWENRQNILNCPLDELEQYRLVYLCEPTFNTLKEKKEIENKVEELVERGIIVIIEPVSIKNISLFDVVAANVKIEESPKIEVVDSSPFQKVQTINMEKGLEYGRGLLGLDEVYYRLAQNDGRVVNDIVGAKKVGNGKVLFVGNHLSQYLKASYTRNLGMPVNEIYPECSEPIKNLFLDIFDTYGVTKNYWPERFDGSKIHWNYKSFGFSYDTNQSEKVTVSVTYSPRWTATLDGEKIDVEERENFILLNLPAGKHQVTFHYGLTIYGMVGYVISAIGLLVLFSFMLYYDIISAKLRKGYSCICKFLQVDQAEL